MTSTNVEARLRLLAKIQVASAVIVVAGMFVVIALLSLALVRAGEALDTTRALAEENCFNIEVNRGYYESLELSLSNEIRSAGPGADLALLRELVANARIAKQAMITVECQEVQG